VCQKGRRVNVIKSLVISDNERKETRRTARRRRYSEPTKLKKEGQKGDDGFC
jgi:hypothetical protein